MGKKRKLQHAVARSGAGRNQAKVPKKPNVTTADNSNNGPAKKKKGKQRQPPEKPTIPFEPRQRILLYGEGDLSFSASIVEHHGCTNVIATVFEKDAAELLAKYPHVETNAAIIRGDLATRPPVEKEEGHEGSAGESASEEEGEEEEDDEDNDNEGSDTESTAATTTKRNNTILYNIDATKPPASLTRSSPFDTILFNFPHVGGKSTDVNRQVRYNQELLVSFFTRGALPALAPGGSVVVTLFEGEPYTLWNIRDLARHAGLQVERSFRFQAAAYPGYHHARTLGVVRNRKGESGGGWRGEDRPARSYVFRRKGDVVVPVGKKRRRGDDDSSDDDDDD